ncbi:hypothetical protein [Variovorax boronicumulans]
MLHYPEETVACDFSSVLIPFPEGNMENPISDYFLTTGGLVKKIIDTKYSNDADILGLLVLGVVSAAEFYFRTVLSELARACPLCIQHTEAINIPSGSVAFYSKSGFSSVMSAFEHESLADSKKIISEIKRFVGFSCSDNSSVKKALDDFELLCELRHCFVHSRGFVGLKAIRALGGARTVQKVLIKQQQALDFIKLSHNAVRAVNHYLSNEVVNRWIDKDVLSGQWTSDKTIFTRYWRLFAKKGEDSYLGSPQKAYAIVRPKILKRRQAIAAKVISPP